MPSSPELASSPSEAHGTSSGAPPSAGPGENSASAPPPAAATVAKSPNAATLLENQGLRNILLSDIGATGMLTRVKQSVVSIKEFATFLKKKATLEGDSLTQLKKLTRNTRDAIKRPDGRQGTFSLKLDDMIRVNERLVDVASTHVAALHIMHDELLELAKQADKTRKNCKETSNRQESNLVSAESAAEKAKSKYDSLAEEFERMKTGDPSKTKFGFQKSRTPQHEEDLHKKVIAAESDYKYKVENANRVRKELETILRPRTLMELTQLIVECDSALSLQLIKYSNLSETLALNNGCIILPLAPPGADGTSAGKKPASLKEMACGIDNTGDLERYIMSIPSGRRLNRPKLEFIQNPTMKETQRGGPPIPASQPSSFSTNPSTPVPAPSSSFQAVSTPGASSFSTEPRQTFTSQTTAPASPSLAQQPLQQQHLQHQQPQQQQQAQQRAVSAGSASTGFVQMPVPGGQQQQIPESNGPIQMPMPPGTSRPFPVYGTNLEDLLDHEGGTVPKVVYQCIQAVDSYGLEMEGIYRTSGNALQVQEIKRLFDQNSNQVDLLHPSENLNDIHSVASALKLYFRDLPDPLLTKELHNDFLNGAKIDNDIQRRDAIHATVNNLPDANYTTLRYLVFHLHRVQEREAVNKMSTVNLGIVWGPTLMNTDFNSVSDMTIQGKVVETILSNAYVIFDAD